MFSKSSHTRWILLVVVVTAVFGLLVAFGPTQASPADQAVASADLTVIADGLANPRSLTFGPDGSLYVAEAGSGGDGVCIEGPEGIVCYGDSGAITRITFDESRTAAAQTQVITGLPSLGGQDTGDAATGPHAVAFDSGGDMYLITGLGGPPSLTDPSGPLGADGANFAQLMTADPVADSFSPWVDLGAYEASENPDGGVVDTNPFNMIAMGDSLLVVDAGGNDLLMVSDTGVISTTAVFEPRMVEFPPGSGSMIPMDAVPTTVRIGPDGAYYVSQLTGFPFPVGGANIYRVEPGEDPEVYADGFSSILGFDFAADGSLYVLEMFTNGQLSGDPTGAVIHVATDDSREVVASEGLITPTGLTIGPDQAVYVSNFGTSGSMGQVVRIPTELSEAPQPVQRTVTLEAAKDNTLYESETGTISNGAGEYLFAGNTNGQGLRRALVAFDLGSISPAANVTTATLTLTVSRSVVAGDVPVTVHTVDKDWGEGASDAVGEEGAGATAETGDATWLHTFYDTELWTNTGGDFAATPSATTMVGGSGQYDWSSDQLVADVGSWLAGDAANNGWAILAEESEGVTAKRYNSRENEAGGPSLTITYEVFEAWLPVTLAP